MLAAGGLFVTNVASDNELRALDELDLSNYRLVSRKTIMVELRRATPCCANAKLFACEDFFERQFAAVLERAELEGAYG